MWSFAECLVYHDIETACGPRNYPIKWDDVRGVKMKLYTKVVSMGCVSFPSKLTCLNRVNELNNSFFLLLI